MRIAMLDVAIRISIFNFQFPIILYLLSSIFYPLSSILAVDNQQEALYSPVAYQQEGRSLERTQV
jgi:hypothetical protein